MFLKNSPLFERALNDDDILRYVEELQIEDGTAYDIDQNVSKTNEAWHAEIVPRFGNPLGLSHEEIIAQFRYFQHYWNTPEAHAFMDELAESEEMTLKLPVMDYAAEATSHIHARKPICCYITARPRTAYRGTREWLARNGFPEAPIVMRPENELLQHGSRWKAALIRRLFPRIKRLFDDSDTLLDYLGDDYQGTLFLIGAKTVTKPTKIDVRPCPTWHHTLPHFAP